MGATTIYDVKCRYFVEDDRGAEKVRALGNEMAAASRRSDMFKMSLGGIGAAIGGVFGFVQGKRALVDFNSDLEQAKIQMAGLMEMNTGGTFADNMVKSEQLVGRLQQRARASIGTTKDMVQMASMLAQPLSSVQATLGDIEDVTAQVVVASRAMGVESSVAARDVDQAIREQFHAVDQFTGKVLAPLGFVGEEGRKKFNALTQQERFMQLRKALNSPAIKDMAKAQEGSFAGVLSTFQDTIQMTLGSVGVPLFRTLTAEIRSWNDWLDKNKAKLDEIGSKIGRGLVSAFETLKSITIFLYDNWGKIAVLWGGSKIAGTLSTVAGLMGNISKAGGLAGYLGIAGKAAATGGVGGVGAGGGLLGAAGALTTFAAKISLATTAATLLAAGLEKAATHVIESGADAEARKMQTDIGLRRAFREFRYVSPEGMSDTSAKAGVSALKDKNLLTIDEKTQNATLNTEQVKRMLLDTDTTSRKEIAGLLSSQLAGQINMYRTPESQASLMAEAFAQRFEQMAMSHGNLFGDMAQPQHPFLTFMSKFDPTKFQKVGKSTTNVKVDIHRIEVQSEDPDRFVFNLHEAFQKTVKAPSQAFAALRNG